MQAPLPGSDLALRRRCRCSAHLQQSPAPFRASFHGRRVALPQSHTLRAPVQRKLSLQVTDAITRKRKEETVEYLTESLQKSIVLFGVRYKNIPNKAMTELRRNLPPDAKMIVAKNSLLSRAADGVEGWGEIKQAAKLENAWVFAGEEGVADTVKAYLEFEKKLLSALPQEKRKTAKPTDISGGVLQGQFLDVAMVKQLKDMPTRKELMAKLGRLIRKVPTKLAISLKLVPTKLAVAVKQLGDGDENKDLVVGDVFPKAAPADGASAEAAPAAQ